MSEWRGKKSSYKPKALPESRLIASRISESETLSAVKRPKLAFQPRSFKCPHCGQVLAEQTFKRHKQLYLNSDGSWITAEGT